MNSTIVWALGGLAFLFFYTRHSNRLIYVPYPYDAGIPRYGARGFVNGDVLHLLDYPELRRRSQLEGKNTRRADASSLF